MESVPTQFTAGSAKLFSFDTWKTFYTSSPVITPGFTKSKILDMSLVLYRRALYSSYFKLHVLRLRSLTPVTYLCKLLGIHSLVAFLQLELFRV